MRRALTDRHELRSLSQCLSSDYEFSVAFSSGGSAETKEIQIERGDGGAVNVTHLSADCTGPSQHFQSHFFFSSRCGLYCFINRQFMYANRNLFIMVGAPRGAEAVIIAVECLRVSAAATSAFASANDCENNEK